MVSANDHGAPQLPCPDDSRREKRGNVWIWLAAGMVCGTLTWVTAGKIVEYIQRFPDYSGTDFPGYLYHFLMSLFGLSGGLVALVFRGGPEAFPDRLLKHDPWGLMRIGTAIFLTMCLAFVGVLIGTCFVVAVFTTTTVTGMGGLIVGMPIVLAWQALIFGSLFYGIASAFAPPRSAEKGRRSNLSILPIFLVAGVIGYHGVTTFVSYRNLDAIRTDPILHPGVMHGVWFTPDSQRLITAGGEIKIWDLHTKSLQRTIPWDPQGRQIVFSSDSRKVALYGQNLKSIQILDLTQGTNLVEFQLPENDVHAMVGFDPLATTFATVHRQAGLKLWDIATGALRSSTPIEPFQWVKTAQSKEGRYLGFVTTMGPTQRAYVWDSQEGRLLTPDLGKDVWFIKFLDEDRMAAVASGSGVRLYWTRDWSRADLLPEDRQRVLRWAADFEPHGQTRRAADEIKDRWPDTRKWHGGFLMTHDHKNVVLNSEDGAIGLLNLENGAIVELCRPQCFQEKSGRGGGAIASVSPDSQWLAMPYEGRVALWHLPSLTRAHFVLDK